MHGRSRVFLLRRIHLKDSDRPRHLSCQTSPSTLRPDSNLKPLCLQGRLREALSGMATLGAEVRFHGYDALLTACIDRRAFLEGQLVHAHMIKSRYLPSVYLATRLLIMYVKCDSLNDARHVLEAMPERSIVSWTAMISGYSQKGHRAEALELFVKMMEAGKAEYCYFLLHRYGKHGLGSEVVCLFKSMVQEVRPDGVSFLAVLSGCSHGGLVDEGLDFFDFMVNDQRMKPDIGHYGCVIDLLGRAGKMEKALDLMKCMPFEPTTAMWGSLLGACRVHANVSMGEFVAQKLLDIEPENSGNFVILSNIYAAAGRWQDVARIRELMKERTVTKEPGRSWINLDKTMHTYYSNDRSHPQREQIYAKIMELYERIKEAGYVPDLSCVLHDVDDEQKESILLGHSEKLALAFGLMGSAPCKLIRITKNLRICVDCHNFAKYVSKVYARNISLRDCNRFHLIVRGTCTCRDYW
ncbi:hypothetical protein GW17_00017733 [Ensete ventricosum]|nr:hypothetical protein GW17_00017733 [Ensete ventricosum]